MKDLGNYRKSYEKSELIEDIVPQIPMKLFEMWFQEAENFGGIEEVNTMTISSIGLDGFPKARVVLLKQILEEGFIFYTNYNSEKGKSILENPKVCLSFFWPSMERQVIIKGFAEKTSSESSTIYFQSRPIGSQLGAIVSAQSEVIPNRKHLESKLEKLVKLYENQPIPRPENWGGFIVKPISIEFWQGRANRLHDRIRYEYEDNDSWKITRLAP